MSKQQLQQQFQRTVDNFNLFDENNTKRVLLDCLGRVSDVFAVSVSNQNETCVPGASSSCTSTVEHSDLQCVISMTSSLLSLHFHHCYNSCKRSSSLSSSYVHVSSSLNQERVTKQDDAVCAQLKRFCLEFSNQMLILNNYNKMECNQLVNLFITCFKHLTQEIKLQIVANLLANSNTSQKIDLIVKLFREIFKPVDLKFTENEKNLMLNLFKIIFKSWKESDISIILMDFIPTYLSKTKSTDNDMSSLDDVWSLIFSFTNTDDQHNHDSSTNYCRYLFLLCSLTETFFSEQFAKYFVEKYLASDLPEFWCTYIKGFTHGNSLVRKRTMYFFKQMLSAVKKFALQKWFSNSIYLHLHVENDSMEKFWFHFTLIMESLEETQFHIIEPSLGKLDSLILHEHVCKRLDWLLVLIHRMLLHDCVLLRRRAATTFLQMKFLPSSSSSSDDDDDVHHHYHVPEIYLQFFTEVFMDHLMQSTLFYRSPEEESSLKVASRDDVASALTSFFSNISLDKPAMEMFIARMLAAVSVRTWAGPVLCHFFSCLLNIQLPHFLNISIIPLVRTLMNATVMSFQSEVRYVARYYILLFTTKYLDTSELTIGDVRTILSCVPFGGDHFLHVQSPEWLLLVHWLTDSIHSFIVCSEPDDISGSISNNSLISISSNNHVRNNRINDSIFNNVICNNNIGTTISESSCSSFSKSICKTRSKTEDLQCSPSILTDPYSTLTHSCLSTFVTWLADDHVVSDQLDKCSEYHLVGRLISLVLAVNKDLTVDIFTNPLSDTLKKLATHSYLCEVKVQRAFAMTLNLMELSSKLTSNVKAQEISLKLRNVLMENKEQIMAFVYRVLTGREAVLNKSLYIKMLICLQSSQLSNTFVCCDEGQLRNSAFYQMIDWSIKTLTSLQGSKLSPSHLIAWDLLAMALGTDKLNMKLVANCDNDLLYRCYVSPVLKFVDEQCKFALHDISADLPTGCSSNDLRDGLMMNQLKVVSWRLRCLSACSTSVHISTIPSTKAATPIFINQLTSTSETSANSPLKIDSLRNRLQQNDLTYLPSSVLDKLSNFVQCSLDCCSIEVFSSCMEALELLSRQIAAKTLCGLLKLAWCRLVESSKKKNWFKNYELFIKSLFNIHYFQHQSNFTNHQHHQQHHHGSDINDDADADDDNEKTSVDMAIVEIYEGILKMSTTRPLMLNVVAVAMNNQIDRNALHLTCLVKCIARSIVFGNLSDKADRFYDSMMQKFYDLYQQPKKQYVPTNSMTRLNFLKFLTLLDPMRSDHQHFSSLLLDQLAANYKATLSKKNRCFGNSQLHRQKQRLVSAMFLMERFIHANNRDIMPMFLEALQLENQPSVRFLICWIIIRMICPSGAGDDDDANYDDDDFNDEHHGGGCNHASVCNAGRREHLKGEHLKGEHSKGEHSKGEHSKGEPLKRSYLYRRILQELDMMSSGSVELKSRPSYAISLFFIISHVLNRSFQNLSNQSSNVHTLKDPWTSKTLNWLLNWCSTAHSQTRISAQASLLHLTDNVERIISCNHLAQSITFDLLSSLKHILNFSDHLDRNRVQYRLSHSLKQSYHYSMDPWLDCSLEAIYHYIPLLTNMCHDESISPSLLTSHLTSTHINFPLSVPEIRREILNNCLKTSTWKDISKDDDVDDLNEKSGYKEGSHALNDLPEEKPINIQKKIIPLKESLFSSTAASSPMMTASSTLQPPSSSSSSNKIAGDEEEEDACDLLNVSEMEDRDLIVVASLVESIPNLGGLCRTCEIFGIKRLVLGSLKVTSDVGFEKLSVTSHKWMNIEEVTSKNLPTYLRSMRNRGYKLVGLEQTSDSRRMGSFTFPKKSLIVLGNERTGIPVELMQLLDECIEIPQKGVIRSLNVHVSAAILLWEYFKQTNAIAMNSESGSNNDNINEI